LTGPAERKTLGDMTNINFVCASSLALLLALGAGTGCSSSDSGGSGGKSGSGGSTGGTGGSTGGSGGSTGGTGGSTGGTGGSTGGTGGMAGSSTGGMAGSSTGGAAGSTSTCSGSTPVALTIKNISSWCDVSVNGGAAWHDAEQTICVSQQDAVNLSASPLSGFILGSTPWHDTDGDTGNGDPGTVANGASSTTETPTGTTDCVWVCCPFTSGSGCPTTDQCP
jgi:hypothetical protein